MRDKRRRGETDDEWQNRLRWKHYPAEMLALLEHDTELVPPGGHFDDCPICPRPDPRAEPLADPRLAKWIWR